MPVNSDIRQFIMIYSPVMAFLGYLLIFSIFFSGTVLPVIFPVVPFVGAVAFLFYLRKKSRIWWIGFPYPLLLLVILVTEFIYTVVPGVLYGLHVLAPSFKIVFYLLIAPASLFLIAAATKEFRQVLKVPFIAASVVSALILLVLVQSLIALVYGAGPMTTDVTAGFIIFIFAGLFAMPLLIVSGIIYGLKVSEMIRKDLAGDTEEIGSLSGVS